LPGQLAGCCNLSRFENPAHTDAVAAVEDAIGARYEILNAGAIELALWI